MCIEVQNFRMLRERNGRFAAEELMPRIAQTLRKSVRASDSVSSNRAGQFVVALQDTEASSLPAVRRRIAARLLPFQTIQRDAHDIDFCIDGKVIPGKVLARSGAYREAATLPESREPRTLASCEYLTVKAMAHKKSAPCTTAESLCILLLEKSPHDVEAILEELRNAGLAIECTVVADRSGFEEALGSGEFAAVLAADCLPDWNVSRRCISCANPEKTFPFFF